jgi:hypothetical protein
VRSASRYGRHDFGTNAARVRSLLDDIDARINAHTEEQRERTPPRQPPAKGQQPGKR